MSRRDFIHGTEPLEEVGNYLQLRGSTMFLHLHLSDVLNALNYHVAI